MDSLTQIVLGAACGELVAGKKIGNKAILYGAIGGTIPDLDILIGKFLFNTEIAQEAFHRGFMHSIVFAILMSMVLAYSFHTFNPKKLKIKNQMQLKDWILLWFLSIFTHPILDCFTAFGTQLFQPFTNYRVAFNTISVVDFAYTLPFLSCILVLMFFKRNSAKRRKWLLSGIAISSIYLLFTVVNKLFIDHKFKQAFATENINYARYTASPTLFNNILWCGIAENETDFYVGYYSWFDSKPISFQKVPKNRHLIAQYKNAQEWKTLNWFTSGYNTLQEVEKGKKYKFGFIKYGTEEFSNNTNAAFSFNLEVKNGKLEMLPRLPNKTEDNKTNKPSIITELWSFFKEKYPPMWQRLKGN